MRGAVAIVGAHYAVNAAHGVAHGGVPVPLTTTQTAFVVLVVALGPLLSLWLLREDRRTVGWGSLAAFLTASLLFGLLFHYVVASPDHVANVPAGAWKLPFEATAAVVALVDGVGAVAALRFAARARGEEPAVSVDSTS